MTPKAKFYWLAFALFGIQLFFFSSVLHLTHGKIGDPADFYKLAFLPALGGLLFFVLGGGLFLYLHPRAGLFPMLVFHALVGTAWILLPEFQTTHRMSAIFLLCIVFIPPTLLHFTFLISEMFVEPRTRRIACFTPYVVSLLFSVPYLFYFWQNRAIWIRLNGILAAFLLAAYLLWIFRLIGIMRKPQLALDRILARYLLIGQLVGIVLPAIIVGLLFALGIHFSFNILAPLTLLFPLSLWAGVVPGQRRQQEVYLVQSEKRSAFGNLLEGLAHELNNPLTFIYSNIEPLRENIRIVRQALPDPDAKTHKALDDMDRISDDFLEGAGRACGLLEKFRGSPLSRTEPKQEVDLIQVIESSLNVLSPKWKDRIQIRKSFGTSAKISGYAGELSQVFTNLLSNSFDAIPEQGQVEIAVQPGAGGVKVRIRDTGIGIPKERFVKIFDPFFTTKAPGKGTGLGLAITLQFIKNHKGSIEVNSQVGKGTEFLMFFPH